MERREKGGEGVNRGRERERERKRERERERARLCVCVCVWLDVYLLGVWHLDPALLIKHR